MNDSLRKLLDHLAEVLSPKRLEETECLHRRALNWEAVDRLPVIIALPDPEELSIQPYPFGEMFNSPEKMLFNELVYAFNTSIASRDVLDDDLPHTVRANLGTVVMASMFGACVEQLRDNPPWVRHDEKQNITLKQVLDCDPLDFTQGWCPRVTEMYSFYDHVFSDYPELKQQIRFVLPDLQSPLDNLELIVGSDVFMYLYSDVALVEQALDHLATAQIGFAKHLSPWLSEPDDVFSHQHATMIKGNVLLRNDSVIMISPQMYRDVVAPRDERVMCELGGGAIHSCGKVDAHVPVYAELPSLCSIDLGQSELNDVEAMYQLLKQRKLPLIRVKTTREELVSGRIMESFPTGVNLLYEAESVQDAQETIAAYHQVTGT